MVLSMLYHAWGWVTSFRLLHWGPAITLSLITYISYTTLSTVVLQQLGRVPGQIELGWYLFSVVMITVSYLKAMFNGPGHAPSGWKPEKDDDAQYLQFCKRCVGYKPPRAHHCSICNKCCYKMDHHCPWINNCVGNQNHKDFFLFLTYVLVAGTHSCILLGPYVIRGVMIVYPHINRFPAHIIYQLYQMLMALVLSLALIIAVGCLWCEQAQSLFTNMTGIEKWILRKAEGRSRSKPFVYPYDLGSYRNLKMVFGPTILVWFFPIAIRSTSELADGIQYPIKSGCSKYDLTNEQLQQKRLKKKRSFVVEVVSSFNTSLTSSAFCLPVFCARFGYRTIYACPDFEENRLSISPGENMTITRTREHWVYGRKGDKKSEKNHGNGAEDKEWDLRGWVPRVCVRMLDRGSKAGESVEPVGDYKDGKDHQKVE